MHRLFSRIAVLTAALALSACVTQKGRDFPADKGLTIVPGKTTKAEVLSMMGVPFADQTGTVRKDSAQKELPSPVVVQRLEYFYSIQNSEQAAVSDNVTPHRYLSVFLIGDQVVSVNRTSSFLQDSTAFDVSKASSLKKGQTSVEQVIQLLGKPSGRALYPFAPTPNGQTLFYQHDVINAKSGYNEFKALGIGFDDNNLIQDFSLRADSVARPVAPTPVIVPIVLPSK